MSALDYLTGALSERPPARGGLPTSPRTLVLAGDISVHLQEDVYAEQVIVFSLPGTLRDADWLAGSSAAWKHSLPHPRYAGVRAVLTVVPETAQVYLIDVCDRTALDSTTVQAFLTDHAARHTAWRQLLEHGAEDEDKLKTTNTNTTMEPRQHEYI